jgi:hypothetical protein
MKMNNTSSFYPSAKYTYRDRFLSARSINGNFFKEINKNKTDLFFFVVVVVELVFSVSPRYTLFELTAK